MGSEGKIETDNCYPNHAVVSNGKNVYKDLPLNFFMERYTESFATELQSFTQALIENRSTAVTGIDSAAAVTIAHALQSQMAGYLASGGAQVPDVNGLVTPFFGKPLFEIPGFLTESFNYLP